MNYNEIKEPNVPFPMLYNDFKKEIISVVQRFVQKGVPYCCISEAMGEFARQCAESSNIELNEYSARYNQALEAYSNAIREQENQPNPINQDEYVQQSFEVSPDGELGVTADGQVE
jgi:hypothetical protein